MGVPVVSMHNMFKMVSEYAGKHEEFSHPFYLKAKEMIDAGDTDQ